MVLTISTDKNIYGVNDPVTVSGSGVPGGAAVAVHIFRISDGAVMLTGGIFADANGNYTVTMASGLTIVDSYKATADYAGQHVEKPFSVSLNPPPGGGGGGGGSAYGGLFGLAVAGGAVALTGYFLYSYTKYK